MARARPGASTVAAFLSGLTSERRTEVERVLDMLRRRMPSGYDEVVSRNMLVYQVPLERYPDTYNGHPLWYVALASGKSYLSLHLMPVYGNRQLEERLVEGFRSAGKKLKMGKACIRFSSAKDLALDVIGDIVATIPVDRWIQLAEAAKRR